MTGILVRVGDWLSTLSGWRRFGVAILIGAVSALGFAPFDIFPLFLLAVAALVLLLDGAASSGSRLRNGALAGWAFGFGQFVVGMHWIFYPFLVDPLEHAWQIPFVAVLFPGGLALFVALAAGLAAQFWRHGPSRIFLLAFCYAAGEWLRGHVLTGLPWNLPAYSWGASLAVMQTAALVGAYGLSLLTLLLGASFAELFGRPRRILLPSLTTALFVLMWGGGELRLHATPTRFLAGVNLRIVQPNIPQDEKYIREYVQRNWDRLVDLTMKRSRAAPTVIIWPEAAPPILLQRSPEALDQ
ncbi:MAG TPA: hypothetical protein VMJ73_09180, partial [Rhizomicrobium sp.]|nr:hypothetical protein [Rhizomicrobium sp.]